MDSESPAILTDDIGRTKKEYIVKIMEEIIQTCQVITKIYIFLGYDIEQIKNNAEEIKTDPQACKI